MNKGSHPRTSDIANRNIRVPLLETSVGVTELEGVILGIVASRQPCSTYAVLSRFRNSPSSRWSSSTGAIYPAIRRLKDRGFLSASEESRGNRRSQHLSLSDKGRSILHDWVTNLTEEMGSAAPDPICMRVTYLAALTPTEQLQFIDRAEEITRGRLELAHAYRGDPEAKGSWTFQASARGAIKALEARLEWLGELRALLPRPMS